MSSSSIAFIIPASARDPENACEAGKEDGEDQGEPDEDPEIVCAIERDLVYLRGVPRWMRLSRMTQARLLVVCPPATIHRLFLPAKIQLAKQTKSRPHRAKLPVRAYVFDWRGQAPV